MRESMNAWRRKSVKLQWFDISPCGKRSGNDSKSKVRQSKARRAARQQSPKA